MSKNRIIPALQRRGFNAMIALPGAINHEMCIGEEVSLSPPLSAKHSRSSPKNWEFCFLLLLNECFYSPSVFLFGTEYGEGQIKKSSSQPHMLSSNFLVFF